MKAKTLQIIWHSKDPVFSIDFHPDGYFATGGADREIKIWELSCAADGTPGVRHAASLEGHNATVNCVRFSKTEAAADSSSREENVVSGVKWKMAHTLRGHHDDVTDIAWAHDDAVLLTGSVENEVMLFDVHNRQNLQRLLGHRHYVQGVAWDPLGAWLVSASADRSVRVHGLKPPPSGGKASTAVKSSVQLAREFIHSATLLKRSVQAPATPPREAAPAPASPPAAAAAPPAAAAGADAAAVAAAADGDSPQQQQVPAKPLQAFLFQDESLAVFFRRMSWSPDGSLLAIPAGLAKAAQGSSSNSSSGVQHTTYVYARGNWSSPVASLPCPSKASTAVKFCPLLFQLQQQSSSVDGSSNGAPSNEAAAAASGAEAGVADPAAVNVLGLPYRMVLAVATLDSVLLYDMQTLEPFLMVGPLHYAPITDITWSRDGSCLAVSSHDGYCSLVTFQPGELGVPLGCWQQLGAAYVILVNLIGVVGCSAASSSRSDRRRDTQDDLYDTDLGRDRYSTYDSPINSDGGRYNTYDSPRRYMTYNNFPSHYDNFAGPYGTYDSYYDICGSPYRDRFWKRIRGPPWQGELPADLLKRILQYVDCRQRMNTMALVSRAWRTAADAAAVTNQDVRLLLDDNQDTVTASLVEWLRKHGSGVRSINLMYVKEYRWRYVDSDHVRGINPNLPFQQLAGLRSLSLVNAGPEKDGARLSNGNDCKEMEEFLGWNDYELQSLLDSNCKWQAFKKRKDREEELAGLKERAAALEQDLCEAQQQNASQQHENADQQHTIADLQHEIINQQHEIVGLQQEVQGLRQQKRHRQQEQSNEDRFRHRQSSRRQC
ncbi:hypothetical protein OEZ86_010873 [Tetradesmus obliquus]|nr:hypothetical protein OEZ86_010873 [Tetradesmus obliquus]